MIVAITARAICLTINAVAPMATVAIHVRHVTVSDSTNVYNRPSNTFEATLQIR